MTEAERVNTYKYHAELAALHYCNCGSITTWNGKHHDACLVAMIQGAIKHAEADAERRGLQRAAQYARECKAVETDRMSILAFHKMAYWCEQQAQQEAPHG